MPWMPGMVHHSISTWLNATWKRTKTRKGMSQAQSDVRNPQQLDMYRPLPCFRPDPSEEPPGKKKNATGTSNDPTFDSRSKRTAVLLWNLGKLAISDPDWSTSLVIVEMCLYYSTSRTLCKYTHPIQGLNTFECNQLVIPILSTATEAHPLLKPHHVNPSWRPSKGSDQQSWRTGNAWAAKRQAKLLGMLGCTQTDTKGLGLLVILFWFKVKQIYAMVW